MKDKEIALPTDASSSSVKKTSEATSTVTSVTTSMVSSIVRSEQVVKSPAQSTTSQWHITEDISYELIPIIDASEELNANFNVIAANVDENANVDQNANVDEDTNVENESIQDIEAMIYPKRLSDADLHGLWKYDIFSATHVLINDYFTPISIMENNGKKSIEFYCNYCRYAGKDFRKITCLTGINSNMKKHLRKHPTAQHSFLNEVAKKTSKKSQKSTVSRSGNNQALQFAKEELDAEMCRYVVSEKLPIAKIQSENLRRLLSFMVYGKNRPKTKMGKPKLEGMNFIVRQTATKKINMWQLKHKQDLKDLIAEEKYFGSALDIWSCKSRSFMAVSLSYIENFEKKNNFLSHVVNSKTESMTQMPSTLC